MFTVKLLYEEIHAHKINGKAKFDRNLSTII